jgi:glutamate dehydrogenase
MADDLGAEGGVRPQIQRAAIRVLAQRAPALPGFAGEMLRRLHAAVPDAELAMAAPEAMADATASLLAFAIERRPGQPKLRVLPPGPGRGAMAIAEIVTDDMPFLVDSVLAALAVRGRAVKQLLHPIIPVTRDAEGRLTAIGTGARESMMRIAIGIGGGALPGTGGPAPAADAAEWAAVEAAIARTLTDVKRAVADFRPMLGRLVLAESELAEAEDQAFLRWLAEDNFVLLGHRRLDVAEDGAVAAEPAEDLGLLRDAGLPVFDALRDLPALPEAVRAAMTRFDGVTVAKANMRATVHRPQHADVIITRISHPDGRLAGVRLFLGLFAAEAYNRNPRAIPLLRQKVLRVLALAGVEADSHDGRALRNILDTWPRDELFQAPDAEVLAGARLALDLSIRPRAALRVRRDPFERFVAIIAWLPRDHFDTALRARIGTLLAGAFRGRMSAWYTQLADGPLARVLYVIGTTPGAVPAVDEAVLEAAMAQAARSFGERLEEALTAERGEAEGARVLARWRDAFPPTYRQVEGANQALDDIVLAEDLTHGGRAKAQLARPAGADARTLVLRLANPDRPLPLADALPLFESLDLRAIEEVPYRLDPLAGPVLVLHVYRLEARADCTEDRLAEITGALHALLAGWIEADGFNRLVLRAGLSWRECWQLRAMYRWLKQVGFPFAQESVEAALSANPDAARLLIDIFRTRFDPETVDRDETKLDAAWRALLDGVANPDEDRILSRLRGVLDAMLRTNWYQAKPYLSFKLDSALAGDMPAPRPWREIFVHSPRMEGCHLRAGPVARGGIRWSDRREDYRTEILGLMKAQRLKNVVIVPTGAKGGFVLKHPPAGSDRAAFMAEGIACYRTLVRGMLDLTDNFSESGSIVTPNAVVPRDAPDPYIVAAADKGTASFSDIANGLSADYGFWLGDAFASGGSAGYDHKAMGITARGAWVMIDRHFQEMRGAGVQDAPFRCAGVGDMSGDVFGNGLLISDKTQLVAAFDHRHIFLDPDPDMAASFAERARLFARPASSWADYDARLLSAGGAILPRNAKTLPLSEPARALLGIEAERAEPAEILRAILKLPVDLLYFGGIGTYVKASTESQAEAGDRANDAIRIDGRELRARVLGEGANLGMTQAGRIEAARGGVRLNTDALDNSAGVSTSDHEVNIKILLADAERTGLLTRPQRDILLAEMTEEVGLLVLADNHAQSLAVSLEALHAAADLPAHAAMIARLEAAGLLDRAVAGLPDAAGLRARQMAQEGLTRPELAALLPFTKLWLNDAIENSDLPREAALAPLVTAYFPTALRDRFPELIAGHRLHAELIATALSNSVANRLGVAALARLAEAAPASVIVRAAWLAEQGFGIAAAAAAIDAAPAPAATRLAALAALRALQAGAAASLLLAPPQPLDAALAALSPGVAGLLAAEIATPGEATRAYLAAGVPDTAAALAGAAPRLAAAPAMLRLALEAAVTPAEAAAAWAEAGERFGIDTLRPAAEAAAAPTPLAARAKAETLAEIFRVQAALAATLLAGRRPDAAEAAALARDAAAEASLPAIGLALRALGKLA